MLNSRSPTSALDARTFLASELMTNRVATPGQSRGDPLAPQRALIGRWVCRADL
jgi:hypothetical protein